MKKWCNDQKIQWRCIGGESKNHIDDCHGNTLNVLNLVLRINSTGYYSFSQGIDVTEYFIYHRLNRKQYFRAITPFFKQSIFDPRPENCSSFSKKLPPKIV